MATPRVSFVMGVLNGERTIGESIASVLAQTMSDWELIVVDDGSTDGTAGIVRGFTGSDGRVRLIQNETNRGIPFTANRGVAAAQSHYIARLDADDLALPHRAGLQADFLDGHPEIMLVGGWMDCFGETANEQMLRYPTDAGRVAAGLMFRNTIGQSAVMMRRKGLPAYEESFAPTDDYALWATMALREMRLANLGEVVSLYRLHATQTTVQQASIMAVNARRVRERLLEGLGIAADAEVLALHEALSMDCLEATEEFAEKSLAWLEQLRAANLRSRRFEEEAFDCTLTGRYVAVRRVAEAAGIRVRQVEAFEKWVDRQAASLREGGQ